jgi:hypothetical protein
MAHCLPVGEVCGLEMRGRVFCVSDNQYRKHLRSKHQTTKIFDYVSARRREQYQES